ncbi:NuoF family protein [Desulfogranum japonicum]|uniref:NuoF family protein n=1 Tax=Desulfogranum japonicum TaxID=231447 RepID=UPI0003FB3B07|nr:NuoF family protein [Desulfogranum japonicum]
MSLTLEELNDIAEKELSRQQQFSRQIRVCCAASCLSCQDADLTQQLQQTARQQAMGETEIKPVGCLGLCKEGPLVSVHPEGTLYSHVQINTSKAILLSESSLPRPSAIDPGQSLFFTRQNPIVLRNSGSINPERIEEYIAVGGYKALYQAIRNMHPGEILSQIQQSGLRGRGGAGYPTGLKWSAVAKTKSTQKYVICNADEGDPGAFMDRSVLESDPHSVLEGMAIAGYAVGAQAGYIYVRAEYPLAVQRLRTAIRQAEKFGLLGNNIFNSSFHFSLTIRLGAGAFVCGEETAIIASIEGLPGKPRPRPPYPATSGIKGCPTLINNVETFANISPILTRGSAWFAGIGTDKSKGTKVFALAGRVKRTGLIEVPMGTTLREIIFDIGGGISDNGTFKAAQTGGPSGGCIPKQHLDIPMDYESLASIGSIMGSGGLIVLDQSSCMVDVAKFFMEFCTSESCGKCVPCRVGTMQMYTILDKITRGQAQLSDLEQLEDLCDLVRSTSLCGLGQTAPNPVLSTLRFFRDEYISHIQDQHCPAGVCSLLTGK